MVSSSHGKAIEEGYMNLSINDEEEGLVLDESSGTNTGIDYAHCLVGKFLSDRKVNYLAMQDTLSSIWRPVKRVLMEPTSFPNTFLFKFFHELRVLDDGPWTFNQQVLLLKKLEIDEQLTNVNLSKLFI